MKNKIILAVLTTIAMVSLTACSQTDVIGQVAQTSFKAIVEAVPNQVTADEMNGGWSLSAPDNSARFIWSKDYSASPVHDVMLEFDVAPFVAAGLDVSKLPEGTAFEDKIMLGTKLGNDKLQYSEDTTPSDSFNQIVKLYRGSIGYHEALDHYNVDLGGGNKFEWAKNMSTNDKDIVFVVDPAIFIEAGVNPDAVEGWVYASVEMKDDKGKTVKLMKFLKPFDLDERAATDKTAVTDKTTETSTDSTTLETATADGSLVIPISDITDQVSFYDYKVDDTTLEVMAIKAEDGTIRTAFNTCQVCYSSGKGYYEQEGDQLVCQNCGNRFSASDVEVSKGGCNPVPIFSENKTVDETNITISKDYLQSAKEIFENWKS